jgi:hypothetical protein
MRIDKRGQYYLLSALILIAVVITLTITYNYVESVDMRRFTEKCDQIKQEVAMSYNYCFINGLNCDSMINEILSSLNRPYNFYPSNQSFMINFTEGENTVICLGGDNVK